jgi:hypothetical protein
LTTDRSIPMKSMMRYAIYKQFGAMILKRCWPFLSHSILDKFSVEVGYSYFHVIFFYVVNSTSSRPFSPYFHECNYWNWFFRRFCDFSIPFFSFSYLVSCKKMFMIIHACLGAWTKNSLNWVTSPLLTLMTCGISSR